MESIKVSVIMPSLNVVNYIEECIQSAIDQTLNDIEIICIDAGSTDGTIEILQKYSEIDNRIRLFHSDVKSYGAQINQGIKAASGEYIAILETDDFIDKRMYESLYEIAKRDELDYIKADFKKFFRKDDGSYLLTPVKQFEKDESFMYDTVINPHECDNLYKSDYNIWRGLYKRDFLIGHNILLNESKGAAYQDIGFMEEVMVYAERAYYIDQELYFYRTDREDASSYSINALKNTRNEFQRLVELFSEANWPVYYKGLYLHMMIAFLNEYGKTVKKAGYDINVPECKEHFQWFATVLKNAIEKGEVSYIDIGEKYGLRVKELIDNPKGFVKKLKNEDDKKKLFLSNIGLGKGNEIVIFGAGFWGNNVLAKLKEIDRANVVFFADNDKNKHGMKIEGVEVVGLEKCIKEYPEAVYIVANEKYFEEIKAQIFSKGIDRKKVFCPFD